MKRPLNAVLALSVMGTAMGRPPQSQTPTAPTKKSVVFACHLSALTAAQRKRQLELLSPAMRSARVNTIELQNGYAFHFPSNAKTFATVAEWVGNERLCCPFFEFDIHVGDGPAPMVLTITGPQGIKQFIKAELPEMVG